MAFREVSVNEIREVLRVWLGVAGLPAPGYRTIAAHCGVDRKTVRRYVEAAQGAGLRRDDGAGVIDDGLIGAVAQAVRPVRLDGHGAAWEQLLGFEEQISAWVAGSDAQRPLTITKIQTLLARQGCVVPYRTLHRFATAECGFRPRRTTVRVLDGDPGVECQVDFAQMGFIVDAETGRPFVDVVADAAEQKGTGRWTVQTALELGVPVNTIAESVFARSTSGHAALRRASRNAASPSSPDTATRSSQPASRSGSGRMIRRHTPITQVVRKAST